MFYKACALWMSALQPLHQTLRMARYYNASPDNPLRNHLFSKGLDLGLAALEQATRYGGRPQFAIHSTCTNGLHIRVIEEVALQRPYMNLLHFRKQPEIEQPKLLILAPLAGHYATLLRNTVTTLLPDNDIYITDWINARDVAATHGAFHFDDCTDYIMDCLRELGPNTHMLAVCQPTVSALMATAILSAHEPTAAPASLTLISGPVDPHINPATELTPDGMPATEWHIQNTIFQVPHGYAGAGQLVFPGFLQLLGLLHAHTLMSPLNRQKVIRDLLHNAGDISGAELVSFFDEYLAVLDISAPFYLETLQKVFTDAELARGTAKHGNRKVDCRAIRNTALLTIEGEKDEICKPGQTHAAHQLCSNLADAKRQQLSLPECGHYTTWNGPFFRTRIAPAINQFIRQHQPQEVAAVAPDNSAAEEAIPQVNARRA